MCQKVQNLFDIMFHVEQNVCMNTIESAPQQSNEDIAALMRRYRYNVIQMKVMKELHFGDANYADWQNQYSVMFREQFLLYIKDNKLDKVEGGVIDIEKVAKIIADHLRREHDILKVA